MEGCGLRQLARDAYNAASRLLEAAKHLSSRYDYTPDKDMSALMRLAESIPDPHDSDAKHPSGCAFAAKAPLESGIKELDDAERLYAQRSDTSSAPDDTVYTTYHFTTVCPLCGTEVRQGAKFCGACGNPIRPEADGRSFPGTGRNAPCPCGSGLRYKECHGLNER